MDPRLKLKIAIGDGLLSLAQELFEERGRFDKEDYEYISDFLTSAISAYGGVLETNPNLEKELRERVEENLQEAREMLSQLA